MVFNDSRVIPARLFGRKTAGYARVEVLLLRRLEAGIWEALARPSRRLKPGASVVFQPGNGKADGEAHIVGEKEGGIKIVRFSGEDGLAALGEMPLPPYIHTPLNEPDRYQTVYARVNGSVAAPTAGLHFTPDLLHRLESKGVEFLFVTLHIGLDTFRPVAEDHVEHHLIHREFGEITAQTAARLGKAVMERRRIIAVGTTTVRLLEYLASKGAGFCPFAGEVGLFITPGYQFRLVNTMITNFHLPRSTLLMLVSAFAGKDLTRRAYEEAINQRYRFYSFGDAMLVL